jgi:branched-chain amino acid aminotransferase
VRVILTRGSGKLDLDPAAVDDTQLVVIVFPLGAPTPEMYEKGVAVAIVSITRNSPSAIDPAVKSGHYLNNILALGEARRRAGAYEAILCGSDGSVAEGSTSNIFTVVGGEVRTPPLEVGILDGITRAKVLDLCRKNGVRLVEMRMFPAELRAAEEAFLTSATRGVLPVTRIDDKPLGAGVPGPVTRKLMALYDALARQGVP